MQLRLKFKLDEPDHNGVIFTEDTLKNSPA
jgi:hypothetical protein